MLTWNGVDIRSLNTATQKKIGILNVRRDILPSRGVSTLDVNGRDGTWLKRVKRKERTIDISIALYGDLATRRTTARTLAQMFDVDQPQSMVFSDEPDKTYYGILSDDTALDDATFMGTANLKFIIPNPYAQGKSMRITGTGSLTAAPWGGTTKTYPIVTVKLSNAPTSFYATCGGKKITLTGTFVVGDVVVIDCDQHRVTVNGVVKMSYVDIASRFFYLDSTNHVITFGGATFTSTEMTYYERWA